MNHEEIIHLRDRFLSAAITGVLANPNLVDNDTKPERVVHLANAVANRVLDAREKYYRYEDERQGKLRHALEPLFSDNQEAH